MSNNFKASERRGYFWLLLALFWILMTFLDLFKNINRDIIILILYGLNGFLHLVKSFSILSGKSYIAFDDNQFILRQLFRKTRVININDITDVKLTERLFNKAIHVRTLKDSFYVYDMYVIDVYSIYNNLTKELNILKNT